MKSFCYIFLLIFLTAFQNKEPKKISFCEALKQFREVKYDLQVFNSGQVIHRDSSGNVRYNPNVDVMELKDEFLYTHVNAKGNVDEVSFHGDMKPKSKDDMERYFSEFVSNIEACGFKITTSNNVRYYIE